MLYYLFTYLQTEFDLAGSGLFQFLTFRAALSVLISLVISLLLGGKFIRLLQRMQAGEVIRKLGLKGEEAKAGTPSMGGLIIITAVLVPTLLLAQLHNIYVLLILFVILALGAVGFVDDYIKIYKKDKGGLAAKSKLIGQLFVGFIVGMAMFFHSDIYVRKDISANPNQVVQGEIRRANPTPERTIVEYKAATTNVPFFKKYYFDYASPLTYFFGESYRSYAWILFVPFVMAIFIFLSNGNNLTDGMDGLSTGICAIIFITFLLIAYLSGNAITARYLNIMHLPNASELVVFIAAAAGASIGFLWHNSFPATVFQGDTGSLAMGGVIAGLGVMLRTEFLLPILCGVFIVENFSVMIQVAWFKYTKRKYGEGRRVFLMAPLHHHFQKKGYHESKVVSRFWIIGIMLAIITMVTFKIR